MFDFKTFIAEMVRETVKKNQHFWGQLWVQMEYFENSGGGTIVKSVNFLQVT